MTIKNKILLNIVNESSYAIKESEKKPRKINVSPYNYVKSSLTIVVELILIVKKNLPRKHFKLKINTYILENK